MTSAITLEIIQTAKLLLGNDAVESVLALEDASEKESESKKIETKDIFDKAFLNHSAYACSYISAIQKAQTATKALILRAQSYASIQDLPPEV